MVCCFDPPAELDDLLRLLRCGRPRLPAARCVYWSTSEVASPSPVVVVPIRRELSAERAAGVVNHGQGLGKIRTERIGGHVCSCRGMSGEASQEEVGTSHSSPSMSAPTSTGAGTGVGRSQLQDRHFRGRGVVGVVAVPAQTGPPAQHQTMDPAVPVDHGQRVVQMPAAHC
jgi:hypothetical protein